MQISASQTLVDFGITEVGSSLTRRFLSQELQIRWVKGGAQGRAFQTSIPSDSDEAVPGEGALERHLSGCCDPLQPAQ